ncbi:type VI secretion system Vgr family protein [Variovorax sp.]|uniref:type VI secretion system Vgr family protein n=1 Tax=Variovorax sp. TaxID=1871043 RepID=UPI003BA8F12D
MDRIVIAHTPLAEDQLMFRSMNGTEGLSRLFEFEVDLLSPSASIDLQSVLGKPLSLEIKTAGAPRFLCGQVVRFSMIGREGRTSRHTVYRAIVRPWLWYLTRTSGYRIFQNKTVVEMLEEVFADYSFAFEKKLTASYRQWEHCAQYNESDFAFVSRLMELEGIYYYFKHEQNEHTLVLVDDIGAHEPMPGYETIDYFASDRDVTEDVEVIDDWRVTGEVRTGRYTVDDFNFTTPGSDLTNVRSQPQPHDHADYEMYEWLGEFTNAGEGEHYARVRLEEAQALGERSEGHATVRGMAPGYKFSMRGSSREDDNREYLIVSVTYALREGGYASGVEPGEYGFGFVVQPTSLPYRAPRVTSVPRTSGPQTAVVVGPEGKEIWTDQYGRVKVQFRWDRSGRRNENCSCFVRVSQVFAGDGFGAVFTPRIGQEVIVDFIGGLADRPIITGRVYNPRHMPPFDLPGEDTKSGFVTRSTQGGSPATANSLVFEDRMGAEFVALHAERNLDVSVEADETHDTGGSRTTVIEGPDVLTDNTLRDATVNGPDTLEVNGPQTITINGPQTQTVNGLQTETINGPRVDTVLANEIRTVVAGRLDTVTAYETVVINGVRSETVHGPSSVTVDDAREDTFKSTWTREVTGASTDTLKAGLTETITGTHKSTVSDAYDGEAKTVTIKSTGGDVVITASGDMTLEANWVKKISRELHWDSAPVRLSNTGINVNFNAIATSSSGLANFNNLVQVSTNGARLEFFGFGYAFGLYATTQTLAQTANKGYDIEMGEVALYFKLLTGFA